MTIMTQKRNEEIKEEYFSWLCYLVKVRTHDERQRNLAKQLHQKEYYALIPNDDNRVEDGKKLRQVFADEQLDDGDCPCLDGPCSMLEMLVALSKRVDFILGDSHHVDRTSEIFWELVNNLGLRQFLENDPADEEKVYGNDVLLDNFLSRKYSWTGRGGLFPLKKGNRDQRNVELWYQMMAYLEENYSE